MTPRELPSEMRYRILEALESNPNLTQRELATMLGVSLGKVNYCLQALIEKGWIKVRNFRRDQNKLRYIYFLTPAGVEEKARVTVRFLRQKMAEVEALNREIDALRRQVEQKQICPPDLVGES
jgi:MarR family transcriptional regulator, temperature-dependent positive regulator of motility